MPTTITVARETGPRSEFNNSTALHVTAGWATRPPWEYPRSNLEANGSGSYAPAGKSPKPNRAKIDVGEAVFCAVYSSIRVPVDFDPAVQITTVRLVSFRRAS